MPKQPTLGIIALASCLLPGEVVAQGSSELDELLRASGVRRGDDVYITDADGRLLRGSLVNASATILSVSDGEGTRTLAKSEIRRIERHDSVAPGVCMGLGIAFGAWAGLCRVEGRHSDTCYRAFQYLLPTLAVGGLVGWSVDRGIRKTLYETPGSAKLTVSPLVSRDRAGAMASVTW